MANKKMKIKHFADLKMHAAELTHMTPQEHPASRYQKGAQLMAPNDMASGTTGGEVPFDHTNISD